MSLRGLSLFSGIGGLDLAFEWAGGQVAAMCEIQPYCQKILKKHWPDVPLFSNVKELKGSDVGTVDVIYGGFPCQPFSVAGDRKGQNDTRYLWPEFSRLVGELKPRWVVGENVSGILSIAADDVCRDLERQGYTVGIWNFEAACVGAKHRRERVFFVAHTDSARCAGNAQQEEFFRKTETENAADTERPSRLSASYTDCKQFERERLSGGLSEAHPSFGCFGRWEAEPRVDRMAYGLPNRLDRLRALGNAVVPQQAYPIFNAIMEAEKE